MIKIYIQLDDIGRLVHIASKMKCVVNIICNNRVANAKSYLGTVSIYQIPQMTVTFPNGYDNDDLIYVKKIKDMWGVE